MPANDAPINAATYRAFLQAVAVDQSVPAPAPYDDHGIYVDWDAASIIASDPMYAEDSPPDADPADGPDRPWMIDDDSLTTLDRAVMVCRRWGTRVSYAPTMINDTRRVRATMMNRQHESAEYTRRMFERDYGDQYALIFDILQLETPLPSGLRACNNCGSSWRTEGDLVEDSNGEMICSSCSFVCTECCTPTARRWQSPSGSCNDCWVAGDYQTCTLCDNYGRRAEFSTVDGREVCQRCASRAYTCDICTDASGHHVLHVGSRYEEIVIDPESEFVDEFIFDYGYKPRPRFHTKRGQLATHMADKNVPYLGIELETDSSDRSTDPDAGAGMVYTALGDLAYCKHDGSLSRGFEIVTHPMSIDYVRNLDLSVLGDLVDMGFESWGDNYRGEQTCGIHVHVGRDGFRGAGHQWRFAHLFVRNAGAIERFAGRKDSHWANFNNLRHEANTHFFKKGYDNPERYRAVNLCNKATIEIRAFRGSLYEPRVRANLELVDAAVQYTRDMSPRDIQRGALRWVAFRDYMNTAGYDHAFALADARRQTSNQMNEERF